MWLLIFLFGLCTLLIGWFYFGYFIYAWFLARLRSIPSPRNPERWPFLSVVIPCYNEADIVLEKLKNTLSLDYPHDRLEVCFVDGGSTDGTCGQLEKAPLPEWIRLKRAPNKGKINQLNSILGALKGDIIVNTDCDTLLSRDALTGIAAEFEADPEIAVVGAYCRPDSSTMTLDRHFWSAHNKSRLLETEAGTSSIVTAPCYAFRKSFLSAFPEDVVADDIYVSFLAHAHNRRVVYSGRAEAVELRGPRRYSQFFPHKFRKANAFLRESLRFVYLLPEMDGFTKVMFLTRLAQQLLLPWSLLAWFLLAGSLATLFRFDILALAALFILALFLTALRVFASIPLPDGKHRYSLAVLLKGNLLTNLVLVATGISYPFFRQGSSYKRLSPDSPATAGSPTPEEAPRTSTGTSA